MKTIRILIADDHAVVRRGLRSILQIEKDFLIVGEASNGIEAVEMTNQLKPHVVIMDLIMPEKSGGEATAEILAKRPETRILLLTTFGTADDGTGTRRQHHGETRRFQPR
jgi:NarL family two-component system response regulator LiaR